MHSTEKAPNTALNAEKSDVPYTQRQPIDKIMTDGTWHVRFRDGAL